MKEKLEHILSNAMSQIEQSGELDKLNEIRVAFLGKKGELTSVLKSMKDVAPEDRPKVGQMVNEARAKIESSLEEKKAAFERKLREEKMKAEVIDVTLPGRERKMGHRHPNTIALEEVETIFIGMGYEVVEGPEVEYDYYNFEHLTFRQIIRQKMSKILSILTIKLYFVLRLLPFRYTRWKKGSYRFV